MIYFRFKLLLPIMAQVCCVALSLSSLAHAQQPAGEDAGRPDSSPGRQIFVSTCSGCHGLDGRGSERAPSVVTSSKVQSFSDSQLGDLIRNGINGAGMPPFRSLTQDQVRGLVRFLRVLQGASGSAKLPGDPALGKELFFGKEGCSTCHSIAGTGGFLGPDLSAYATGKSASEIAASITDSARIPPVGYKLADIVTSNGTRLEGIVRNEDNFSIQLQSRDGSLYSFDKSDLRSFEYVRQSLMPTNYKDQLSRGELDSLVSYLMSECSPEPAHKTKAEDQ